MRWLSCLESYLHLHLLDLRYCWFKYWSLELSTCTKTWWLVSWSKRSFKAMNIHFISLYIFIWICCIFLAFQSLLLQAWLIPFVTKLRKKLSYWFVTSGWLILWTTIFLLFSILYKRNKESKVCFKGNLDFQFKLANNL